MFSEGISPYKKWLILFIIILSFFIMFREYQKRIAILNIKNQYPQYMEQVPGVSEDAMKAVAAIKSSREGFTTAINPGSRTLTLPNYFIKSSYNSCLEKGILSTSLSIQQLERVITQGYRFLDFELCYINGKVAVCANDTYNDDTNQNATNTILFSDAIKSIKTKAFTMNDLKQPANWNEPLFIHLRLKFTTLTDTAAKKGFYDAISAALSDISVYTNISLTNVTNIKLNEVTSGIYHPCFIMLDITNVDTTASSYVGSDFSKLINTTTGFTNKAVNQLYFYDDLAPVESGGLLDANKQKIPTLTKFSYNNFRIVVPKGQYLPSTYYPYDFVKNYGAQVLTQSAFLSDYGMSKYSQIFTGSYGSMTAYVSIDSVNRLSMQDVRYDMMRDIKLGIYISICLVLGVGFISSMYT